MINCVVCDEGNFKSKFALAEHRSEKHFYKCPECFYAPKEYKLIDSLRKHIKTTHNENFIMTCCKFCDMVFMDLSLKSTHMSSFHSDILRNARFDSQTNNFSNFDVPKTSTKRAIEPKLYEPECQNVITTDHIYTSTPAAKDDIGDKIEIITKKDTANRAYKCPKCPTSYYIAKSLRKHCRKKHNRLSICFCHQCHKVRLDMRQNDPKKDNLE